MTTEGSQDSIRKRAAAATKWSLITEGAVKIISPITQVILAHILAPEAFGVVATATMVTSFADMLSDAGFQKYLIQHEFGSDEEMGHCASVAFWTNLLLSLGIWLFIGVFCDPIAALVGNPGLGIVLVVACSSLPLTALSSIQLAIYHRGFAFKSLFFVRVVVAAVPLLVSVPLALLGFDYWAIVIGTIAGNLVNAVALTLKSSWKPQAFYSLAILKEMLSFSSWTLLEAFAIWLTSWGGTFVLGTVLSQYYLGIYKTSTSMVNAAMGIITTATTPVLFATLCRYQGDRTRFEESFFAMQRKVAMFVVPLGIGIFVFRDFATEVLLGSHWEEASLMLGLWGLSSSFVVTLSHYASEVFRAKGLPRISFINQVCYLVFYFPAIYAAASMGFEQFSWMAAIVRVVGILLSLLFLRIIGFPAFKVLKNVAPVFICALLMGCVGELLRTISDGMLITVIWIFLCICSYAAFCLMFPSTRNELALMWTLVKPLRKGSEARK